MFLFSSFSRSLTLSFKYTHTHTHLRLWSRFIKSRSHFFITPIERLLRRTTNVCTFDTFFSHIHAHDWTCFVFLYISISLFSFKSTIIFVHFYKCFVCLDYDPRIGCLFFLDSVSEKFLIKTKKIVADDSLFLWENDFHSRQLFATYSVHASSKRQYYNLNMDIPQVRWID